MNVPILTSRFDVRLYRDLLNRCSDLYEIWRGDLVYPGAKLISFYYGDTRSLLAALLVRSTVQGNYIVYRYKPNINMIFHPFVIVEATYPDDSKFSAEDLSFSAVAPR